MKVFEFDKIPIVEIVNEILLDGVKKGASDIHFDPSKDSITIRMRVDGVLHDYSTVPMEFKRNMISRVKMIASMNIMETRLPQDGAIKSKIGDKMLDLRVSSLPTNCGEKVVLRILDYSKSLQGLETLGFSEENLNKIFKMVAVPNGIVLVTGATGSGKSTTVYSILQKLNTREVNIITVEDPVEMDVEGINQVQAQQEIGLDFANVLRSILRQDPDIIMIGEIRDTETAQIAVRASITGHKVLSTIHTNSALTTIERLIDMNVERYLIGTSLSGIISQKLARKLCPHCKIERDASDYEKRLIKEVLHQDVTRLFDANEEGCPDCTHGYKNRVAIAEVLFINDDVRTGITNMANKETMRKLVYGHGNTHTLLQDGLDKVVAGETSMDEVLRLSDLENDLAITKELEAEGLNDFKASEDFKKEQNEKESLLPPEKKEETKPTEVPTPEVNQTPEVKPVEHTPVTPVVAVPVVETPKVETPVAPAPAPTTQVADVTPAEPKLEILTPEVKEEPKLEILTPEVKEEKLEIIAPAPAVNIDALAPSRTEVLTPPSMELKVEAPTQKALSPSELFDQQLQMQADAEAEKAKPIQGIPMETQDFPFEVPVAAPAKPIIELSAVIPPNNTAAAVNLNTGTTPKNLEIFQ